MSLSWRIEAVRQRVSNAATRADRDPADITIVAVSKTVGRDAIDAAYDCGLRHFGENRVQDARAKMAAPLPSDATLHMIGHLQSNKAKVAAGLFQIVESVDRVSVISALDHAAAQRQLVLPVLLQVNIAGEAQKAGCRPTDTAALIQAIGASPHLTLRGLMAIAPLVTDPEETRPVFRGLRELRDRLVQAEPSRQLPVLSMGMTNDFEVAIEEGATHVRIGRAIFSEPNS